jgi:hypothetical protein
MILKFLIIKMYNINKNKDKNLDKNLDKNKDKNKDKNLDKDKNKDKYKILSISELNILAKITKSEVDSFSSRPTVSNNNSVMISKTLFNKYGANSFSSGS